jgi:hypothetical protein
MKTSLTLRLLVLAASVLPACMHLNEQYPADAAVAPSRNGGSTGAAGAADSGAVDRPGNHPGGENAGAAPTDPGCEPGFHRCGGVCVDGSKPETCGASCEACPSVSGGTATCTAGMCGVTCPTGKKPCLEACIDENAVCEGSCPAGKNPCQDICVDAKTTTACGASCTVCPTSPDGTATCDGNQCTLVCNPGFHLCGDRCLAEDDPKACGSACSACEVPAGGEATCDGKQCGTKCPAGTKICKGACIGNGQACDGTCPAGKHDCSGNCVDDTQTANCGSSCTPCAAPANAEATCGAAKTCGFKCRGGFHQCGDKCEPNASPETCGSSCSPCAAPANGAATCAADKCGIRCDSGFRVCGTSCISNDQPCNGACAGGRKLCQGACIPSNACCNNADCGTCQECNNGTCSNQGAGQDRKNECSGNGCNAGRCRTCTPNTKTCSGTTLRTCASDGSRWDEKSCFKCEGQTCTQCTPSAETCDGKDNDCDGQVDEGDLCIVVEGGSTTYRCTNARCVGTCNSGFRSCGGKCEAAGQFCGDGCTRCGANETCTGGKCQPNCQDECKDGVRRCSSSSTYQTCGRGSNGCLVWGGGDRSAGMCNDPTAPCKEANGTASCVKEPTCGDEGCTVGAIRCTNGSVTGEREQCVSNSAGCRNWKKIANCPSGGVCESQGPSHGICLSFG